MEYEHPFLVDELNMQQDLKSSKLQDRRPVVGPLLTGRQHQLRLIFGPARSLNSLGRIRLPFPA